jgi:UTP--glucose-1-phosphate uridylyltransferase
MVRKIVFPVAGMGTRFLPATKEVPKEMFPVLDKPLIQYGMEEALASGMEEFILVIARGKESLQRHFTSSPELEESLRRGNKERLLESLQPFFKLRFTSILQERALGLGHAVSLAEAAVGNEPFAVLLPDDLILGADPVVAQMVEIYRRYQAPLVAFMKVSDEEIPRYGIAGGPELEKDVFEIRELVEKPPREKAPSNFAVIGRYLLTPDIFPILRKIPRGSGGEIQLTDAIAELAKRRRVLGFFFRGRRFDAGTVPGFVETLLEVALQRPDTREFTRALLRRLARDEAL